MSWTKCRVTELTRIDVKSEPVQTMIRELVNRRVAVTSTLAIFEALYREI